MRRKKNVYLFGKKPKKKLTWLETKIIDLLESLEYIHNITFLCMSMMKMHIGPLGGKRKRSEEKEMVMLRYIASDKEDDRWINPIQMASFLLTSWNVPSYGIFHNFMVHEKGKYCVVILFYIKVFNNILF